MAKKTKASNKRLLILLLLLLVVAGITAAYKLTGTGSVALPGTTSGNHISPTPTSQAGNTAKSQLATATPAASSGNSGKTAASTGSASYIQSFSVTPRSGGEYVATILSSNAASGSCTVTLTPTSGSPVTKAGSITSTGSSLACDFGGVIAVSGSGTAHLVVTGADGKTDTKDTTF